MPDMNPNNGNINDVLRRFSQELERQRIEIDRLKTQRVPATGDDGWLPAMETWTYASATTFTVAGDVRSKYPVGTQIKLTQTTVKYFYVVATSYSSPNTTVTITGGSDYSLANATIIDNWLSYMVTPQGFPSAFSWSPVCTGFSSAPSWAATFSISGGTCFCVAYPTAPGTSNAPTYTMTIPVAHRTGIITQGLISSFANGGVMASNPGMFIIGDGASSMNLYTNSAQGVWSPTGSKYAYLSFIYPVKQ